MFLWESMNLQSSTAVQHSLSCICCAVPDTTDSSCLVPCSSLQAKAGLYMPGEAAHCYVFSHLLGTELALEEFLSL